MILCYRYILYNIDVSHYKWCYVTIMLYIINDVMIYLYYTLLRIKFKKFLWENLILSQLGIYVIS